MYHLMGTEALALRVLHQQLHHEQNGVAERKNRSLMEMARCMLKAKSLPHKLWMEAVACAAHVLNRCPTRALKTITPYESWYEGKPSVSYLRIFGCLAYAHIPQQLRGKLDDKAVRCIFVGYSSGSKGYRLYNPATNKIFESRDVIFGETTAQPMVAFDVPHMQTQDVFEGFLPSFVENQESQQVDNFDQSFDQHVTPHDVEEIVLEEQEVLREERTLPKWVQKNLQDSKLDAPLPRKTRAALPSQKAQYPKQKQFCYTQGELHEEHGLSLEGKLYQHLSEANVTEEDWLSIFKKKYTPQQNGVAECKNKHIVEVAHALMSEKNIPPCYWIEVASSVVYTMNKTSTTGVHDMTLEEKFIGKKLDVSHFKLFGCITYVHVLDELRTKLDPKVIRVIYGGNGIQGHEAIDEFHLSVVPELKYQIAKLQAQQGADWQEVKKALKEEYFLEDSQ
ncbi:hypothetical protein L7F22_024005 [Adiantum nelumboides]|nr:hypothetical protein [Adiantum nelumboides]